MTESDLHIHLRTEINRRGFYVLVVMPMEDSPDMPFGYTIGNAMLGLPELLVVGVGPRTTFSTLSSVSEAMRTNRRAFDEMARVRIGGIVPVTVIDADDRVKDDYTIQVGRTLGIAPHAYRVQQIVVPDERGLFPWSPGCADPYRSLPVYRKGGVQ